MPTLKQINCSIELGTANVKLKEYGARYSDGHVETFIAVPEIDLPFSIHVTTEGYIAPGLAVFVFIDGEYQCNRNRVKLKLPAEGVQRREYETEFRLRQKEEKSDAGSFVVRDWKFAKLNRVAADNAPSLNPQFTNNVGTIEIIALRCKTDADDATPPRMFRATSQLSKSKAAKSVKQSASKPAKEPAPQDDDAPASLLGGLMGGVFDGVCDNMNMDGPGDMGYFPNRLVSQDQQDFARRGSFAARQSSVIGRDLDTGLVSKVGPLRGAGTGQLDGYASQPGLVSNQWNGPGRNDMGGNRYSGFEGYPKQQYKQHFRPMSTEVSDNSVHGINNVRGPQPNQARLQRLAALIAGKQPYSRNEDGEQSWAEDMRRLKEDIKITQRFNPQFHVGQWQQLLETAGQIWERLFGGKNPALGPDNRQTQANTLQEKPQSIAVLQRSGHDFQDGKGRIRFSDFQFWMRNSLEDVEAERETVVKLEKHYPGLDWEPCWRELQEKQQAILQDEALNGSVSEGVEDQAALAENLQERYVDLVSFYDRVQEHAPNCAVTSGLRPLQDRINKVHKDVERINLHVQNMKAGAPRGLNWPAEANNSVHGTTGISNYQRRDNAGWQEVGTGTWHGDQHLSQNQSQQQRNDRAENTYGETLGGFDWGWPPDLDAQNQSYDGPRQSSRSRFDNNRPRSAAQEYGGWGNGGGVYSRDKHFEKPASSKYVPNHDFDKFFNRRNQASRSSAWGNNNQGKAGGGWPGDNQQDQANATNYQDGGGQDNRAGGWMDTNIDNQEHGGSNNNQDNRGDGWAGNDNENNQGQWGNNNENNEGQWPSKNENSQNQGWGDNDQNDQNYQNNGWGGDDHNDQGGAWDGNNQSNSNGGWNSPKPAATNAWDSNSKHSSSGNGSRSKQRPSLDPKAYIKPYWKAWNLPPGESRDVSKAKKQESPRDAYVYPPNPMPPVPSNKAKEASHGVQTGKGAEYTHVCRKPTYIDTMEAPYAVFSFKYRSKNVLEKILKMKIDDVDLKELKKQAEKDKYMNMPKHKLVAELIKKESSHSSQPRAEAASGANNGGGSGWGNQGGGGWASGSNHSGGLHKSRQSNGWNQTPGQTNDWSGQKQSNGSATGSWERKQGNANGGWAGPEDGWADGQVPNNNSSRASSVKTQEHFPNDPALRDGPTQGKSGGEWDNADADVRNDNTMW